MSDLERRSAARLEGVRVACFQLRDEDLLEPLAKPFVRLVSHRLLANVARKLLRRPIAIVVDVVKQLPLR